MKEVLIYGALIAAVLGVSTTMIGQLSQNMEDHTATVNTAIQTNLDGLIGATAGGSQGGGQ